MATFVVAHGAWGGGWSWSLVRPLLRDAGHEVFTPTYTGLGKRAHLASRGIDLATHVRDIVGVFEYEDLGGVILVGHGYGRMVATGAAARVPERLGQLVYLDAFVPEDGESLLDLVGTAETARFEELAINEGGGRRVPPAFPTSPAMPGRDRRLPHPVACFRQPVTLGSGRSENLPRTYIYCSDSPLSSFSRFAEHARTDTNWRYFELATGHNPQLHGTSRTHQASPCDCVRSQPRWANDWNAGPRKRESEDEIVLAVAKGRKRGGASGECYLRPRQGLCHVSRRSRATRGNYRLPAGTARRAGPQPAKGGGLLDPCYLLATEGRPILRHVRTGSSGRGSNLPRFYLFSARAARRSSAARGRRTLGPPYLLSRRLFDPPPHALLYSSYPPAARRALLCL